MPQYSTVLASTTFVVHPLMGHPSPNSSQRSQLSWEHLEMDKMTYRVDRDSDHYILHLHLGYADFFLLIMTS